MDTLFNFYINLNNTDMQNDETIFFNIDSSDYDEILNSSITETKNLKCIKLFKKNKCSTNDILY